MVLDDLAERKKAASLIKDLRQEIRKDSGALQRVPETQSPQLVHVEATRVRQLITADERKADHLDLVAEQVDTARRALNQHRKEEIASTEMARIIDRLFDELEAVQGIREWGFPNLRPLSKFQKSRKKLRDAMLKYHEMRIEDEPSSDPVRRALCDPARFSDEFDSLERRAVSLRDFLREEAARLRKARRGAVTPLSDTDEFNREWPDLLASAALGFLDEEVNDAIERLNGLLRFAGVKQLELDASSLTLEKLDAAFKAAAEVLHPDKNVTERPEERARREDDFKTIGQLVRALKKLLRRRDGNGG